MCSYLECALTLYSDKKTSLLAILVFGINREIGATHHTDLDLTIDNQGQTHCKLLASQESFCAVNGV